MMRPDDNVNLQKPSFHEITRAAQSPLHEEAVLNISPEESPHLLDYWNLVLKRRWTVLACVLVVFSTVTIGTLKKKPIYEGKVVIEIKPEEPSVVSFKEVSQVTPTVDIDAYRETQYRVIQSRTLAERIVQEKQLYKIPEFYKTRMLFGLFEGSPEKIPSNSDFGPVDTSSQAFRNAVNHFMDSVDVSPIRRSNLVEVSVECEEPHLAQILANKLADDYIDQNFQVKWDETTKASAWLQGQLPGMKASLEKSEDNLQAYAHRNGILFLDPEKQDKNFVNVALEELQGELTKAQAERALRQALYSQVEAGKVQDLPGVLGSPLIQHLEEELVGLEKEYAQTTAYVKPDFPSALRVKKQIDAVKKQIDHEKKVVAQTIVDEYHSAVKREKLLSQEVENQKKLAQVIADRSIQYNILKRDVDTNKQLYEGLLQRMKEAQLAASLRASNVRVVDPAELPPGAVKPRVLLNLVTGLVLGLGLGVGLSFFQEYLDKTLKSSDEVETLLRLPSLGVLPKFHLNGNEPVDDESLVRALPHPEVVAGTSIQTGHEALEAFRSLRTSILLSASPVPRLILVSSALPGEGKTTTAVNLGATLASLGSRVVVVDCDMRRPTCHTSTGVENKPGFVQCLTGRVDLSEAILPVPRVDNLHVIPCGPIPPNPAEVLSSPLTSELLHRLRSEFEYVLVDSPPLLSVADSRILATMTDAVVLVARAYSTPYDIVRRARGLLYGAGARILGVALNEVDFERDGSGYDSYRYGYGYGYGSNGGEEPHDDRGAPS